MPAIKGIVCDLGGVVTTLNWANFGRVLAGGLNAEGRDKNSFASDCAQLLNGPAHIRLMRGEGSPEEFYRAAQDELSTALSFELFVDGWNSVLSIEAEVKKAFSTLCRYYPVVILSNTDEVHWRRQIELFPSLRGRGIDPVLSFEHGSLKPEPQLFLEAARRLRCSLDECLCLDDNPLNLATAIEVGMQARHITSPDQFRHFTSEFLSGVGRQSISSMAISSMAISSMAISSMAISSVAEEEIS